MTKSTFADEAEIHKALLAAIKEQDLTVLIDDAADIELLSEPRPDTQFPQFSIDHLSRLKAIRAGGSVLQSLHFLELLTSDKNISIGKSEFMRPDILCINPEQQSVVLFELKKSEQTGRQALTELLAYEQEIKNVLPLLSDYDFHFILVSSEWSTLMDHAVAGAITWSHRNILCLEAVKADDGLRLRTRLPEGWTLTGSVYFPPEAMPCFTLCLYRKDAYTRAPEVDTEPEPPEEDRDTETNDAFDRRLESALTIIAREGDRLGHHGFALLWRDHHSLSPTDYNLTVCGISPFAFYKSIRGRPEVAGDNVALVKALDSFIRDYDPQGHSDALATTATAANALLEEISDPRLEGYTDWSTERVQLPRRAEPLLCEFWGVLGDYARAYVTNPAIRAHRRSALVGGLSDWRDPRVGLPLIQSFSRPEIFPDGVVRCSDAFRFGMMWGLDRSFRALFRTTSAPRYATRFAWNNIDLMAALDEVRLLAIAAENVEMPDEPLRYNADMLVDDAEGSQHMVDWFAHQFLGGSPPHILFFQAGLAGAMIFDERKQGFAGAAIPDEWMARIEPHIRMAAGFVLTQCQSREKSGGFAKEQKAYFRSLRKALGLPPKFDSGHLKALNGRVLLDAWELCLDTADRTIELIYHRHSPVAMSKLDWTWLRKGIASMRERSVPYPGVSLLADGKIGTGPLAPMGIDLGFLIPPGEDEVYFADHSAGLLQIRVVTWEELEAGTAFATVPTGAAAAHPDDEQ